MTVQGTKFLKSSTGPAYHWVKTRKLHYRFQSFVRLQLKLLVRSIGQVELSCPAVHLPCLFPFSVSLYCLLFPWYAWYKLIYSHLWSFFHTPSAEIIIQMYIFINQQLIPLFLWETTLYLQECFPTWVMIFHENSCFKNTKNNNNIWNICICGHVHLDAHTVCIGLRESVENVHITSFLYSHANYQYVQQYSFLARTNKTYQLFTHVIFVSSLILNLSHFLSKLFNLF